METIPFPHIQLVPPLKLIVRLLPTPQQPVQRGVHCDHIGPSSSISSVVRPQNMVVKVVDAVKGNCMLPLFTQRHWLDANFLCPVWRRFLPQSWFPDEETPPLNLLYHVSPPAQSRASSKIKL